MCHVPWPHQKWIISVLPSRQNNNQNAIRRTVEYAAGEKGSYNIIHSNLQLFFMSPHTLRMNRRNDLLTESRTFLGMSQHHQTQWKFFKSDYVFLFYDPISHRPVTMCSVLSEKNKWKIKIITRPRQGKKTLLTLIVIKFNSVKWNVN